MPKACDYSRSRLFPRGIISHTTRARVSIFIQKYVAFSRSNVISNRPSIKDVLIFVAVFDTPLPHVEILILIYLTSTFYYLATSENETRY